MVTKQLINNQSKPWGGGDLRKRCLGQNKHLYFMDSPPSALPCTQVWLEHESSKVGDTWCNCAEMVEDGSSWCNSNVHNIHRQNQVARVFLFKMPPLERKKECIKKQHHPSLLPTFILSTEMVLMISSAGFLPQRYVYNNCVQMSHYCTGCFVKN